MSFNSGNKVHAIRNEPREPAGRPKAPIFLVVIALVAVLAYSSMYTTNEMIALRQPNFSHLKQ